MKTLSHKLEQPGQAPLYLTFQIPPNHSGLAVYRPGKNGFSGSEHGKAIVDAFVGAGRLTVSVDDKDPANPGPVVPDTDFTDEDEAIAFAEADALRLRAAVEYLILRYGYRGRVDLAGHSAGARSALAVAAMLGAERTADVTVVSPWFIDGFVDNAPTYGSRVNVFVGKADEYWRTAKALHTGLSAEKKGKLQIFDGVDHYFHDAQSQLLDAVRAAASEHPESERMAIPDDET